MIDPCCCLLEDLGRTNDNQIDWNEGLLCTMVFVNHTFCCNNIEYWYYNVTLNSYLEKLPLKVWNFSRNINFSTREIKNTLNFIPLWHIISLLVTLMILRCCETSVEKDCWFDSEELLNSCHGVIVSNFNCVLFIDL